MKNIWIGVVIIIVLAVVGIILFGNKSITQQSAPSSQPADTIVSLQESSSQASPVREQNTITLTSSGFSPADLTIKAGTKVTWENKGGSIATVDSDPHPVHTNYEPLNLGNFPDGGKLTLTFDKPGTYGYHNHFNPGQKGTVIVE